VGQYEMEHNWILHEGLQKNLENFDKEGKKLQILWYKRVIPFFDGILKKLINLYI
jgi:phosphopentomutase